MAGFNPNDMELTPGEMTRELGVALSEDLHPYCEEDNPEPVFMARGVDVGSVTIKEGADWRMAIIEGSMLGQKIPMKMKTFSGDYGEELVGRRVDLVFSFPQRDDPNWGMDLNVVEVIGG